ncbi:sigma-70 family RNA polymerase sigma factor [Rossellomorea aquimaris]|uniref:RNA polymerase sigma factor n=1 Tax=Rossellomorea aquimaris TaxID=189382 RepID=UPI001CD29B7C|nr:sigma-70 family RNA polymerase sigma factor [Rossellomorea aquimaris]MCA1057742.1 sigma-70 family RNA polymerase sigma factor [Rossellomorea aquimaris]
MFIEESKAEKIFREYRDYVYRTALLLTKSRSLADDITQETFIRLLSKYDRYDDTRPIKPWIYTITMNVAKTVTKKQRIVKCFSFFSDDIANDQIDSVEKSFLKSDEMRELWMAVNSLSWKSKEIVVLHFYSEFTLKECSEILGIPIGTAKSRLNTALKQLRRLELQVELNLTKAGLYEER